MTKKKKSEKKRSKADEMRDYVAERVTRFLDKITPEDAVKFGMFLTSTVILKEIGLIRWEPAWEKPTPRQEILNYATNGMASYMLVYKPEAITGLIRPLLKLPLFL